MLFATNRFIHVTAVVIIGLSCIGVSDAFSEPGPGQPRPGERRVEKASTLLPLNLAHFDDPPPDVDRDQDEELVPSSAGLPVLRRLTSQEINRLRYMELLGMRVPKGPPDRVSVKIDRKVLDDFLIEMEGHADFRGRAARSEFYKKTAPQKLHIIAAYKGSSFADRVDITSDPEVYVEFRKNVLPVVLRGCASNGCHVAGAEGEAGFRLYKDPKKTPAATYADFLMLNEFEFDSQPVINRGQPENSLLLTYMLPEKDVKMAQRHPGSVDLKPLFQSRKAQGYERIQQWIASLKHPMEDYGVTLFPGGARPTTQPDIIRGDSPPVSEPSVPGE